MSLVAAASSPLVALETAYAALALVETVDEAKDVRDKAEALRAYAKQAGYGLEVQNRCAELKLRAERKCGELLAAMPKNPGGRSTADTLSEVGVAHHQSSRWQRLATIPEPDFEAYIERGRQGELTTAGALQLARAVQAQNPEKRPKLHVIGDDEEGLPGLAGTFTTIVADPPWQYDNRGTRNAAAKHYPTMTVGELCELPVAAHADDDAHLYLWTTNAFLRESFDVLEAWGFTYKAHLVWVKPQMGMGNYFRISHEHVLFGVRGKLATQTKNTLSWFSADRGRHSAKPESFYDLVESSSPGPYMEMFARTRRMGWSVWGNEA